MCLFQSLQLCILCNGLSCNGLSDSICAFYVVDYRIVVSTITSVRSVYCAILHVSVTTTLRSG